MGRTDHAVQKMQLRLSLQITLNLFRPARDQASGRDWRTGLSYLRTPNNAHVDSRLRPTWIWARFAGSCERRKDVVTFTPAKLTKIVEQWPEFRAFVQETDYLAGMDIIDNAFKHMFSPLGKSKVRLKRAEITTQTNRLVGFLVAERQKAITNKQNIDSLFTRALRAELRMGLLNPGNHAFPWVGTREMTQSEDIETAIDWVLGRSATNKAKDADYDYFLASDEEIRDAEIRAVQQVIQNMRGALTSVVRNPRMDTVFLETLNHLHRSAGPLNSPVRWFGTTGLAGEFYGGTALGGALQRYVEEKVIAMYPITQRNRYFWYDVAVLQMSGYIISHGFADGNGRSARMLFAATQIQKGLPFIPPHKDWSQNQIHRTNVNQVARPNLSAAEQSRYADEIIDAII